MSNLNNSELRLQLIGSLVATISNFTDPGDTEDDRREHELAMEDLSEEIINELGVIVRDGTNPDGSFTTVIPKKS